MSEMWGVITELEKSGRANNGSNAPPGSGSIAAETRKRNKRVNSPGDGSPEEVKNGRKKGHGGTTNVLKAEREETRRACSCPNCNSINLKWVRTTRKVVQTLKTIVTENVGIMFEDCDCGADAPASRHGTVRGSGLDPNLAAIVGMM